MLNERQEQMLSLLKKKNRVTVAKLAKTLYVSEMTVRRDLAVLEKEGYAERFHGGAVYVSSEAFLPLSSRDVLHQAEKERLAGLVRKHLHDSATVFIDSSSTCSYIIPVLSEFRGIKIITNSVYSLLKAAQFGIPCLLTGGEYDPHDMCLVGYSAERFLSDLNIDIGFFTALGISDDGIISDNDPDQAAVRIAVLHRTAKKVFLFSSEKLRRKCLYTVCMKDDADDVIILGSRGGT